MKLSDTILFQRSVIRILAAGKQTYRLCVSLPLDESFGSCLMPSRADMTCETCNLEEVIHRGCTSPTMNSVTASTTSTTEVKSHVCVFSTLANNFKSKVK